MKQEIKTDVTTKPAEFAPVQGTAVEVVAECEGFRLVRKTKRERPYRQGV